MNINIIKYYDENLKPTIFEYVIYVYAGPNYSIIVSNENDVINYYKFENLDNDVYVVNKTHDILNIYKYWV